MERTTVTFTALLVVALCVGCGSVHAGKTTRLHPLKQYRIEYQQSGTMSGTVIQACRNWCNEQVEITDATMSMMGITQKSKTRTVTVRDKVYSVDLTTGRATVTKNPMYERIAQQMREAGDDPEKVTQSWLDAMGFKSTGKTRNIAGETCTDYTGMNGMATSCLTKDGLMLRMETMGLVQVATAVNRKSGGEDADYALPENPQELQVPQFGLPGAQ